MAMDGRGRNLLALAVGGCLLCNTAVAKDQLIDWSFNALPQKHQVDVLQCQSIVFAWADIGDGVLHSVWEFPDEDAYNDCDFSNAKELSAASAASGSYALENDDTLDVTKRWFGCKTFSHCSVGNMKVAVKIRPYFIEKYEQSECVGGTIDIQKNEESLKMCRKRCKRRRGCIAIEYNTAALKNCILYSQSPERRKGDVVTPNAQCELAATSCDDIEDANEGGVGDGDDDDENEDDQPTPTLLVPELKPIPEVVAGLVGFASISGYGRAGTTGGEGGRVVKVDNREDFAKTIKKDEPLIVLVDGMIDMYDPLCPCKTSFIVSSDTTIIGLGKNSGIKRGGLNVRGVKLEKPPDWDPSEACICEDEEEEEGREERLWPRDITQLPADANPTNNIIIRNMEFSDCPKDCVGVETFAHHVWVDHNSFSNPSDGAVDIKRGSDLITVSWNHFENSIKTMLCGHDDDNGPQDVGRLRITIQGNCFDETEQRHPRVRFAEPVHVFNNFYRSNPKYGIASAMDAGLFIEGNYFQDVAKSIRTDVGSDDNPLFIPGRFVEKGNIYERSGLPPPSNGAKVDDPGKYYDYSSNVLETKDVPTFVLEWGGAGVIY